MFKKNEINPLEYGKKACDMMMRKFEAKDLPPEGVFFYHQGVFLAGMYQIYCRCGEEKYLKYIKDWVDSIIDENGMISAYDAGSLDCMQPGILLFPLLELTHEQKYKKALDTLVPCILKMERNEVGGLWHQWRFPNQMWLDGLYMAGPVSVEYGVKFQKPEYLSLAIEQAKLMKKNTEDNKTGLWYHAWDCSRQADWADKETGLSSEFWGRSIGWVPIALLDELDFIAPESHAYDELCIIIKDLLEAVCRYQSEDGRWYQVVDKGQCEGNWLENSCSCLYVAAICKAVNKNILDESYLIQARKGYEGVIKSLDWNGEDIQIGNVCVGTAVGDYAYYCERPTSVNDLHGVGAFLIMCAQMEMCECL